MARRNFYKSRSGGQKKVLKKTIRPTYKNQPADSDPENEVDTDNQADGDRLPPLPVPDSGAGFRSKFNSDDQSIDTDPKEDTRSFGRKSTDTNLEKPDKHQTDDEIAEISKMIRQATARLEELEAQKRQQTQQQEEQSFDEPIEAFDGVSDPDEQIHLLEKQLEAQKKENQKLLKALKETQEQFKAERAKFDKQLKSIKKEVADHRDPQEQEFFSFSSQLQEAVEAIKGLQVESASSASTQLDQSPGQKPILKADEEPKPAAEKTQLTQVETKSKTEPEKKEEPEDKPVETKTEPHQADQEESEKKPGLLDKITHPGGGKEDKKKDQGKKKKLLVSGVTVLFILLGGGLLSLQLTADPKVDEEIVNQYRPDSQQVLGATSRPKAAVPDGIVADKNSEASFDETEWADYDDNNLGIRVSYPANVTERLHTSSSITFLRKESYIFKISRRTTELELDEYWESIKEDSYSYEIEEVEFRGYPALRLTLAEEAEFPGDRILIKAGEYIYDVWYASDVDVYGQDDVDRAAEMVDSLRILL